MPPSSAGKVDDAVIGAGPAGVVAAHRCARLGARTAIVTRDAFGGMAANDGPVPVRTLAHAARLMREARQLPRYGISAGEPSLDYSRLLERIRELTSDVRRDSLGRTDLERAGVTLYEHAGAASFADPHRIECETGPRLRADKIIVCTGGMPRRLELPGSELACTHSDAWAMSSVPPSMLVVGAGATGVQVASIFNAFGSRVTLFEAAPHILMTEDRDVSATVAAALRASGIDVVEDAGAIERFEPCPTGVRLIHSNNGLEQATVAIVAVGWVANTAGLNLPAAGVQLDERGYVRVDAELRTTAPHVFAAGDVTGRAMVVHEAIREGYLAATNAVLGATTALPPRSARSGASPTPSTHPWDSRRHPLARATT